MVPRDFDEAARWYLKAMQQGNYGLAYDKIGKLYEDGISFHQDYALAAKAYQLGANLGDGSCEFHLAWLYERGDGVAKDHATAVALFQKAAQDNSYDAQKWLAANRQ